MQRVRIGLTGLACVFLLVLLAAAFFGLTSHDQASGPLVVAGPAAPDANVNGVEAPHEPLAELGVTPGFVGAQADTNTAAPAPAPKPPAAPTAR